MKDNGRTVAVVKWNRSDEIAEAIHAELSALGYEPVYFGYDQPIPAGASFVFSFAPYGRFLQIPEQIAALPSDARPTLIHWSTENPPSLQLPWPLMQGMARLRSRLGMHNRNGRWAALNRRMSRYRYMGDFIHAYDWGVLDVFVESSTLFADLYTRHGIPCTFEPWGPTDKWYADLGLERDIDVLWMGQRRTRRRSVWLERIRRELTAAGYRMHIADGVEQPFLYGMERTRLLNRSKLTLSLLAQAHHDNIFHYRFRLAAPNRSLVVTETELAHCPRYRAGTHYVQVPVEQVAAALLYYLRHADERRALVEQAYGLATTDLTLRASVQGIMERAAERRGVGREQPAARVSLRVEPGPRSAVPDLQSAGVGD
jgi:hypothetical protein